MHKQNMDRIKAKELIEYVDSKREAFHKRYTDETWGDARNYQLTVNSSVLGVEQTAEQIIAFIDQKRGFRNPGNQMQIDRISVQIKNK